MLYVAKPIAIKNFKFLRHRQV